jgi:xanthine dehydrogenase accessory factor
MNAAREFHERFGRLLDRGIAFVCVTLADVHGSAPHDAGGKMIVTTAGYDFGTVGGGRIEAKAIEMAVEMLSGGPSPRWVDWNLKADVGMTCGGRVKLLFERVGGVPWNIAIFGAGHVTQALTRLLDTLPCRVTCIDPRPEWIERLPAGIIRVIVDEPAGQVDQLPDDTYVLCMTKGHSSDFPVLRRIFETGRSFPFLGVIGSRAKAAVLRKELAAVGIDPAVATFYCPVGLPIGGNHPSEIAISIAAQLLQTRDAARQVCGETSD